MDRGRFALRLCLCECIQGNGNRERGGQKSFHGGTSSLENILGTLQCAPPNLRRVCSSRRFSETTYEWLIPTTGCRGRYPGGTTSIRSVSIAISAARLRRPTSSATTRRVSPTSTNNRRLRKKRRCRKMRSTTARWKRSETTG